MSEIIECSECGHLHFDTERREYDRCPLRGEGCTCTHGIEAEAREAGAAHGRAAASWYFDGNTPLDVYRHVLEGIEDGDPEVMNELPSSPLSGEWADDPTPASVLEDLDVDEDDSYADDYLRAYEEAFSEASMHEIERVAREHVAYYDTPEVSDDSLQHRADEIHAADRAEDFNRSRNDR